MSTRVVHCRRSPYDVYVGRGNDPISGAESKWGNPFSHHDGTMAKFRVASRGEAIDKFKGWIVTCPGLMASLHEVKDKVLGCWCRPAACHGEVIAMLADKSVTEDLGIDRATFDVICASQYDPGCSWMESSCGWCQWECSGTEWHERCPDCGTLRVSNSCLSEAIKATGVVEANRVISIVPGFCDSRKVSMDWEEFAREQEGYDWSTTSDLFSE